MYLQQYYCFLWLPIRLGSRRKKIARRVVRSHSSPRHDSNAKRASTPGHTEDLYCRRIAFGDPLRRAFSTSSMPLFVKRSFVKRSSRVPALSSVSIIFPVTSFPHFQGTSSDPKVLRSPILMSERTLSLPLPLASTSSSYSLTSQC